MELRRWTPFTFLVPGQHVDHDDWWRTFDFEGWSRSTYEWTADSRNGFRDFAQHPRDCVDSERGDCEDYALVASRPQSPPASASPSVGTFRIRGRRT